MIVGLDLHEDVNGLVVVNIDATLGYGKETRALVAGDHRGVVLVGREHVVRRGLRGVADHAEQRVLLRLAIDHPVGVEDLVPAVLRIGLREHHQLHVAGVAPQRAKTVYQVVDLVVGQRQPQLGIGLFQRCAPTFEHVHGGHGPRLGAVEEHFGLCQIIEHHLGHAIVQQ